MTTSWTSLVPLERINLRQSFSPLSAYARVGSYILIPSLNLVYDPIIGVPYILAQIDFTASQNFSLKNIPVNPINGILLCVKYRAGTTVIRFKLWDIAPLLFQTTLYNGETIKKNFVIELWADTTVESIAFSEMILPLSLSYVGSPILSTVPVQEAVGTLATTELFTPINNSTTGDFNSLAPWFTN